MFDHLDPEDKEALCARCGTSCHFAIELEGAAVVLRELRCRFLERADDGRARCGVYPHRFERASWCADIETAWAEGLLGQTCPYVVASGAPDDYPGKRWMTPEERRAVLPVLREAILANGAPLGASPEGLLELMNQTGGGSFRFHPAAAEDTLWVTPDPAPRR